MNNKDIVVQALDLTKSYGEILAVDHLNFEVAKGEIFGFMMTAVVTFGSMLALGFFTLTFFILL